MPRYYLGLDWADKVHAVWVVNEAGEKVWSGQVEQSAEGLGEFAHRLYQWASGGIEIWGSLEKPEGRIVDFLLDHGVVVYPVNPKALDRARDRFRVSGSKSDPFDARVLAEFLRTDHGHLKALVPNSPQAQELKLMTTDYHRLVRQQTRLINQLKATLKECYPRVLEMFTDINTKAALDLLARYPSPRALAGVTADDWKEFAREHRMHNERASELWGQAKAPQVTIPAHVVRAKARLVQALVAQLKALRDSVDEYRDEIERFFASLPAAKVARSLPAGKTGVTIPTIWAEMGDVMDRWESFRHLQSQAGTVPVTKRSGKSEFVQFRFACNKRLRYALHQFAFLSLRRSEWAAAYYEHQRAGGHRQNRALRALAAKWLKIIFVIWSRSVPYIEERHLATINHQTKSPLFPLATT